MPERRNDRSRTATCDRARERHRTRRARHGRPDAPLCCSCTASPSTPAPGTRCCRPSRGVPRRRPGPARLCPLLQARGIGGLSHQAPRARRPGAGEHYSPGRPFVLVAHDWGASVAYATAIAAPAAIAKLVIINGVHPGPFQRALIGGRGPAHRPAPTSITCATRRRGAPVRQQFREAAGHAVPLRPAALADAREARRLSRSLVAARRADGHAQLVSRHADRRAEAGRGGGPGKSARSSIPRSSGCACRISSSGAWTTGRCCPSRAPRSPTTATISRSREIAGADHWVVHQRTDEVIGHPRLPRDDVIPALVAGIQPRIAMLVGWIPGTSPGMTSRVMSEGDNRRTCRVPSGWRPIVAGTGCRARSSCLPREDHRRRPGRAGRARPRPHDASSRSSPTAPSGAARRTQATCPGCKRRIEALGIDDFDDFVARHAEIVFTGSPLRLSGRGHGDATAASLEQLAKTWAGEEYWFWARRVLRKLRHGIRRAGRTGAPPAEHGRDAGRDPGAPATRRQHRHGRARHGQLRPRRAAPRRPARRLAQREGAHRRLRRQLHRRCGPGLPHAQGRRSAASSGCAPPPPASATSPSPC